jgi:NAD(P)-dependent dehydrogenase (short-subunit alcohol dehydrogenase family)
MRLKDKVAVITGAATGIGAATAELFAAEGARVVIADINLEEAHATVARIQKAGGDATFVAADVGCAEQVQTLIQSALTKHGRIDILHNNAAFFDSGCPLHETTDAQWERTMDVNLRSIYFACRTILPIMMQQGGGVIINTASVLAVVGEADFAAYATSKGGVVQITRSIAIDYGRYGIRANALCPGITASPPAKEAMKVAKHRDYLLGMTVLGRAAEPTEIACAALFLASDESSYVTGTCLFVDGGWTCM